MHVLNPVQVYMFSFIYSYYFGFGDVYDSDEKCYRVTSQADGTLVGTVPWESGLINGKGKETSMKRNLNEIKPLFLF